MNELPLVSIICTAYNHEVYIKDALEGFVIQKTNFPFEIIISDDASTDATASVIKHYEEKYSELFKTFYHNENQYSKGVPFFVDELVANARGKYIALCEGDDYWTDPYKLQKQVDFLEANPEYSFCFHNAVKIYEGSNAKPVLFNALDEQKIHTFESLVNRKWFIPTASIVFRNYGKEFPEWFRTITTGDFALELLLAKDGPFYYMPDVMSVYRIHSNSISNAFSEEKLFLYDSLIDVLTKIKEHYPLEKQIVFNKKILELEEVRKTIKQLLDYPVIKLFKIKTYTRFIKKLLNIQRIVPE